jgi:hypothetical protein
MTQPEAYAIICWQTVGSLTVCHLNILRGESRVGHWQVTGGSPSEVLWKAVVIARGQRVKVSLAVEVVGEIGEPRSLSWLRRQLRAEADRKLADLFGDREGQERVIEMSSELLAMVRERSELPGESRGGVC